MMNEPSRGEGPAGAPEGVDPDRRAGSGGESGAGGGVEALVRAVRRHGGRERAAAPPAVAGEDRRGGRPVPRPDVAASPSEPGAKLTEEEQRWVQNWRGNEIRWLHGTVEDLERRLRRRTVALVAALAFGGVGAVAGLAGVLLDGSGPAATPPRMAEAPGGTPPEGLRAEPAAAAARIEELEATIADYEATVARLRTELAASRDEAGSLRERLEVSRRGIERLNATLARATDRAGTTASGSSSVPGTAVVEAGRAEDVKAGRAEETEGAADAVTVARGPGGVSREGVGQGRQDGVGGGGAAGAGPRSLRELLAEFNRQAEATIAPESGGGAGAVEPRTRQEAGGPNAATAAGAVGPATVGAEPGRAGRTAGTPSEPATAAAGAANVAPAGRGGDGPRAGDAERYTAVNPVNMRAAPRNGADIVVVVEGGDTVRRIGRRGGWFRVEYTNAVGERFTGWVFSRYLRSAEAPPRPGAASAGAGS